MSRASYVAFSRERKWNLLALQPTHLLTQRLRRLSFVTDENDENDENDEVIYELRGMSYNSKPGCHVWAGRVRELQYDIVEASYAQPDIRRRETSKFYVHPIHEVSKQTHLLSPMADSPTANWALLKHSLKTCRSRHEHRGNLIDATSLLGFRVIDCTTRQIVSVQPNCKYVTLSYVWGNEAPPSTELEVPSPAPELIEDAIHCTLALGLRFLWIDRYCIDQESESKYILIQNMDKIFSGAEVTIINLAGEGTTCGLPGVSSRSVRNQLPSVEISNISIQLLPQVQEALADSKWVTRGWVSGGCPYQLINLH